MRIFESGLDNDDDEDFNITEFARMLFTTSKNPIDRLIGADNTVSDIVRKVWRVLSIACAIYTILAIELTIVWNGIGGIYDIQTTGQLIPFVIGTIGLFRTLYNVNFEFKVDSLCPE